MNVPDGWRVTTLDQVAKWGSGGTPNRGEKSFYGGSVPWAVIGDLTDGPVTQTRESITSAGLSSSAAKIVPPHAVLIAMYGSIGKLGLPTREMATNQAIAFAIAGAETDRKFLFYYLMSQRSLLDKAGKGATQRNISQTLLRSWPIALPPLAEQGRIVDMVEEHLAHLDAADASLASAERRLLALRDGVTRSAILGAGEPGQRIPSTLDEVGASDDGLEPLPQGWRWTRLEEVADVVGGVTKDSKKQNDPSYHEVPYLRVANVQRGTLNLETVTTIHVAPQRAAALELKAGDVLLNEGGDRDKLARGWVWEGQITGCIHQNHVFRARVRDDLIDPYFLSHAANTIGGKWAERNGKQTTNLASISLSMIKKMPVPVPPPGRAGLIASEIALRLEGLARQHEAILSARQRSAVLRRAVLATALSGHLTPEEILANS